MAKGTKADAVARKRRTDTSWTTAAKYAGCQTERATAGGSAEAPNEESALADRVFERLTNPNVGKKPTQQQESVGA